MLEVYDRDLKKQAVLHLAYGLRETELLNGVGTLSFSLPADDPKGAFLTPFSFIRDDAGGVFYRIVSRSLAVADTGYISFVAEHAIATLVDDIMFGTHIIGGIDYTTREAAEYILAKQTVMRWRLGKCDFDKRFEYGFESENLLNALFSLANLFVEPYAWRFDFSQTPWVVSLLRLDAGCTPDFILRAGKNLLAEQSQQRAEDVCTRLYLLGYGEGDNQLTISPVNGGKPYLQSPDAYVERYGLISRVYVDRQFEDAQSLMERGRALLLAMQEPPISRAFEAVDLSLLTGQRIDRAEAGDLVRLSDDGETAYVTEVSRELDKPGDMRITLSTGARNLARDLADIASRQRIEQVYSQGATQIYSQSIQANADAKTQAVLSFFIPREMRIVNRVAAKISIEPFRSYNRVTAGGGQSTSTSASGGGGAATSASGGAGTHTSGASSRTTISISREWSTIPDLGRTGYTELSTQAYGGDTSSVSATTGSLTASTSSTTLSTNAPSTANTSFADGSKGTHSHTHDHYHGISGHSHSLTHSHPVNPHSHSASHSHSIPSHDHSMQSHKHYIDHEHDISHTHTVAVPAHSHSVELPTHSHSVTVPSHMHSIEQGIFRFGSPAGAGIYIGGEHKFDMQKEREVDLTEHLLAGDGKIPRGSWIRLGVLPDDLAYVTIDLYVQGFVQSRGGGSY